MCRPSVLMHRNWFETAHVPCTSTDAPSSYYALTAHVSRSSRNESACTWNVREACVFGRAPSVIHASGVRRMLVEYCTVFACMRQRARYFSDSSVNCKWYVRGSCVIHAWFVCDFFPRHPEHLVNFSTHKHAQTQSVRDLWVLLAWSDVWLAFKEVRLF